MNDIKEELKENSNIKKENRENLKNCLDVLYASNRYQNYKLDIT